MCQNGTPLGTSEVLLCNLPSYHRSPNTTQSDRDMNAEVNKMTKRDWNNCMDEDARGPMRQVKDAHIEDVRDPMRQLKDAHIDCSASYAVRDGQCADYYSSHDPREETGSDRDDDVYTGMRPHAKRPRGSLIKERNESVARSCITHEPE